MKENKKVRAFIHSKRAFAVATLIRQVDGNKYIAEYEGTTCTAIFNPITCLCYVDDEHYFHRKCDECKLCK